MDDGTVRRRDWRLSRLRAAHPAQHRAALGGRDDARRIWRQGAPRVVHRDVAGGAGRLQSGNPSLLQRCRRAGARERCAARRERERSRRLRSALRRQRCRVHRRLDRRLGQHAARGRRPVHHRRSQIGPHGRSDRARRRCGDDVALDRHLLGRSGARIQGLAGGRPAAARAVRQSGLDEAERDRALFGSEGVDTDRFPRRTSRVPRALCLSCVHLQSAARKRGRRTAIPHRRRRRAAVDARSAATRSISRHMVRLQRRTCDLSRPAARSIGKWCSEECDSRRWRWAGTDRLPAWAERHDSRTITRRARVPRSTRGPVRTGQSSSSA